MGKNIETLGTVDVTTVVTGRLRPALKATFTILGSFIGGALVVSIAAALLGFWPQAGTGQPKIVAPTTSTTQLPTSTDQNDLTGTDATDTPGTTVVDDPNRTTKVGENTLVGTSEQGRGEACRVVVDAFSDGQATAGQMTTAAAMTSDKELRGLISTIAAHLKSGSFDGSEVSATLDYCNSLGIAF
jgi:hypothetical protein